METCESESAPPPSPSDQSRVLLEDPVKQNKAHPLHSNWAFYISELPPNQPNDPNAKHEGHQTRCLGKCSTVEEFWNVFKMTERPSELKYTEAYYLMREPYGPELEKPEHSDGGRWRLRHTDLRSADYLWCELTMSAIGEKLGQLVDSSNSVIGVGVSPRPSGVVIDIWTAFIDLDADQTNEFAQRLNDYILPQPLTFKLVYFESFADVRRKFSK